MIQDLEYLIKLQEIDLRIKEQEIAKEQYPAAVAELTEQIARAQQFRDAAAAKLEQITSGIKDIDDQTAKVRDNLSRSQERLNSIQTNREYDAVHAEIEVQKNMLGVSEGKKKNLEAEIERHKSALDEADTMFESTKSKLQPQIDELNAKIGAIDSNIAEISKERDVVAPNISKHTTRVYDSIRHKRKNGKAVAAVGAKKECPVCFMVLRPQLYSEIRRGSNFILCESCGSMLVWDESETQPAA